MSSEGIPIRLVPQLLVSSGKAPAGMSAGAQHSARPLARTSELTYQGVPRSWYLGARTFVPQAGRGKGVKLPQKNLKDPGAVPLQDNKSLDAPVASET